MVSAMYFASFLHGVMMQYRVDEIEGELGIIWLAG